VLLFPFLDAFNVKAQTRHKITEAFLTWHRHRLLTGATYQLLCIHHLPYNTHTMPPKAESSNAYRDEDAEEDDDDFDDLDGQFSPFPR
jgi:hypothetical protein